MIKRELKVEIADTPFKHQRGLMFRKKLGEEEGMLFKFKYPHKLRFWGFNTFVPLDLAFVSTDNKITKISDIKSLSSKIIESDIDCPMAIEANLNFFLKNKINIGDKIEIIEDNFNTFIKFTG